MDELLKQANEREVKRMVSHESNDTKSSIAVDIPDDILFDEIIKRYSALREYATGSMQLAADLNERLGRKA